MKKSTFRVIFIILIIAVFAFGFSLYQSEPDFLLDRFYERIYSDRLEPAPEVLLNNTPVSFVITEQEWSIQKKNGQWYLPPGGTGDGGAADETPEPAVPASHEDTLAVTVDKAPGRVSLKIIEPDTGRVVSKELTGLAELPLPEKNGSFLYELTMEWTGEHDPYRGRYVLEIPVTAALPEKFVFSAERLAQGQLLEVTVYYAGDPEDIIFKQALNSNFQWHRQDGLLRGYLPTNYSVKPGVYQIRYGVKSKGTELTKEIELTEYAYHIQYLTIDPKTEQETRNDAAYAEYHKYYTPVRNQSEPTRYYTEDFLLPVRGRLTTEFGETRYVNDFPTSYRHLGLDIAAPEGTEVKAANRGKVVLARSLILTGNTVMIDHGEGLFSVYHHLLNLSVKAGEIAERGQKIGEVGSTGFSTGPHLHFMISYYR